MSDYRVSIHAPVMDAKPIWITVVILVSFNPRARDGREHANFMAVEAEQVSIHAPVMDAKWSNQKKHSSNYVSIHAPVMDAKYCMVIVF